MHRDKYRVSVSIGKDWVRTEVGFRVRANAMNRFRVRAWVRDRVRAMHKSQDKGHRGFGVRRGQS